MDKKLAKCREKVVRLRDGERKTETLCCLRHVSEQTSAKQKTTRRYRNEIGSDSETLQKSLLLMVGKHPAIPYTLSEETAGMLHFD